MGFFVTLISVVVLQRGCFFLAASAAAGKVMVSVWSMTGLLRRSHKADAATLPLFDTLLCTMHPGGQRTGRVRQWQGEKECAGWKECRADPSRGWVPAEDAPTALLSLLQCKGVGQTCPCVIDTQNACRGAAVRVARDLGVRTITRQNQHFFESGSKRISHHYKWSLHHAFKVLEPEAPAVVIVEEDLLFSVDFYIYMLSSLDAIRDISNADAGDVSDRPWTASGWNDNGYAGRVRDPAALRMSSFFLGSGGF